MLPVPFYFLLLFSFLPQQADSHTAHRSNNNNHYNQSDRGYTISMSTACYFLGVKIANNTFWHAKGRTEALPEIRFPYYPCVLFTQALMEAHTKLQFTYDAHFSCIDEHH